MPDYVDMLKSFTLNDHHGMVNRFQIKVIAPERRRPRHLGQRRRASRWPSTRSSTASATATTPAGTAPGSASTSRSSSSGRSTSSDTEKVRKWFSETAFEYQPGHLTIQLNDPMSSEVHTWEMRGAMAKRWSIDNLDASANKLATETLEIEHLGFLDDDQIVAVKRTFTEDTLFAMSMRFEVKVGGMDLGGWQTLQRADGRLRAQGAAVGRQQRLHVSGSPTGSSTRRSRSSGR